MSGDGPVWHGRSPSLSRRGPARLGDRTRLLSVLEERSSALRGQVAMPLWASVSPRGPHLAYYLGSREPLVSSKKRAC